MDGKHNLTERSSDKHNAERQMMNRPYLCPAIAPERSEFRFPVWIHDVNAMSTT
jgi:hypothetical protein